MYIISITDTIKLTNTLHVKHASHSINITLIISHRYHSILLTVVLTRP